MTPRPNIVGYAALGAFALAFVWAVRRAGASSVVTEAWVPARPVRMEVTEVLWKASTDDWPDTSGPPTHYDSLKNQFCWGNVCHTANKVWSLR